MIRRSAWELFFKMDPRVREDDGMGGCVGSGYFVKALSSTRVLRCGCAISCVSRPHFGAEIPESARMHAGTCS